MGREGSDTLHHQPSLGVARRSPLNVPCDNFCGVHTPRALIGRLNSLDHNERGFLDGTTDYGQSASRQTSTQKPGSQPSQNRTDERGGEIDVHVLAKNPIVVIDDLRVEHH